MSSTCFSWKSLGADIAMTTSSRWNFASMPLKSKRLVSSREVLVDRVGQLVLVDFGYDMERRHGVGRAGRRRNCSNRLGARLRGNRRMIARFAPFVLSLVLAHAAFALDVRVATTDAPVCCVVTFDLARDTLIDRGTERPIGAA
jgi:hypothetical protein